jgi:hypothetical protein
MTSLWTSKRRSGGTSRPERLCGDRRSVAPNLRDDQPALAGAQTTPEVVGGEGDSDRAGVSWQFRHTDILTQTRFRPRRFPTFSGAR